LGAKLSAFEAITIPSTALSTGPLPFDEMVSSLVAEARDRIAAFGEVEPHAAYGHPAEELAVYSASLDLLVVGSRGYGPIGRLIHGSTSHGLAGRPAARCWCCPEPPPRLRRARWLMRIEKQRRTYRGEDASARDG
jgi:nucleotide-binding universal stress UspA family protein